MDPTLLPSEVNTKNYLFYSVRSIDDDLLQKKCGRWILFSPKDIEKLDDWWIILRKLCDNGTFVAIKSSTATDPVECVIVCYTTAFEKEKEVKEAADEIRKLINYEHPMFYKITKYIDEASSSETKDVYLYVHTVTGEFYKKELTFLVPSDIYWKTRIYYYGRFVPEREFRSAGVWSLYSFGNRNEVDYRWLVLQSLCDDGVLISIKSSTGACNSRKGVTSCFTPDPENIKEVKRAADEIRKLIDYKYAMYYTTVKSDFEKRSDYKYMHTIKGGLYKKDKYMRWVSLTT